MSTYVTPLVFVTLVAVCSGQSYHCIGHQTSFVRYNLFTRASDHPVLRLQHDRFDRLCPVPDASEWAAKRAYEMQFHAAAAPGSLRILGDILGRRDRGDPTLLAGLLLVVLTLNWWLGERFALSYRYEYWTPLLYWLTNVRACEMTLLLFVALKLGKCKLWPLKGQRYFGI